MDGDALGAACEQVLRRVRSDPAYAHTSHLLVQVAGAVVVDEHLRGPQVADVFSVTKTVLATLVGIAVRRGHVPALSAPVTQVLPELLAGRPEEQAGEAAPAPAADHQVAALRGRPRPCRGDRKSVV